jgi:hypothetical protein
MSNDKEIVVKQYTGNKEIKEKGSLVLWIEECKKKVHFYGAIALIASSIIASIPLMKNKNNNDDMTVNADVNSITSIDDKSDVLLNNNTLATKPTIETNLLVATSQVNEATLLATSKVTPTPTPAPKPRKLEDVSKAEQKKINAEIKKIGDKIGCLNASLYAHLNYLEYYLAHPTLSYENVLVRVNMGVGHKFGEFVMYADSGYSDFDGDNITCLSRFARLDKDEYDALFDTSELKEINDTGYLMQKVPHDACEKMIKDAAKAGIKLTVTSGYISFEDQEKLYKDAVEKLGKEKASVTVEKAGYSYAQIATKVTYKVKAGSTTSKWLYNNAYKYGFVYCAPYGKSSLTGYTYNPGSFFYVGIKYAKLCHDKNLPFSYVWHRYIHPGVITWGPPVIEDDEYVYDQNMPLVKNVDMLLDMMDAIKNDSGVALTKNNNHGIHV